MKVVGSAKEAYPDKLSQLSAMRLYPRQRKGSMKHTEGHHAQEPIWNLKPFSVDNDRLAEMVSLKPLEFEKIRVSAILNQATSSLKVPIEPRYRIWKRINEL